MDSQLIFREGLPAEKNSLQQLGILSYSQFSQILSPADWATMHRFLYEDKMWDQLVNNSKIFVCETNDKLAGMAYLVPSNNPTHIYPADWCYVRMVGVDPAYRGKGIARRLTQMCVDYARETNEKIVGLHTSEKMNDAIHIYESIGFKLYKEIDPIYGMRYFTYRLEIP
ncbi:MAG TPA: GNAT family N-acetyltransferase [Chitinophagaceae bacterium]|nr:GNAT family N-acetyltransferase [Chitinophagaceae bacterium]